MGVAALVAALVHGASLRMGLNADDFVLLLALRDHGPFGIWSGRGELFFRPLTAFTLWLDGRVFGGAPWGYHLVNLLLAMAAAALVALVARRLAPGAPAWTAAVAGATFALMPAHAEAVEWIACRGDGIAAVFALGAVAAALRDRWAWAAAFTAIGLTAKESTLMVPILLLLFASAEPRVGRSAAATAVAAALMLGVRGLVLGRVVGGYQTSYRPAALAFNCGPYLVKALSPSSIQEALLSPLRPLIEWMLVDRALVAVGALVVIAGLALAFLRRRREIGTRGVRLAGALFLGFFVLALPALPLGMSYYTWEGSRFVYLPSFTLAILFALGLARVRPPVAVTLALGLGVAYAWGDACALTSWRVAGDWARQAVDAVAPLRGRILVLGAPDSYRGAYVLRGALDAALALRGKGPDALVLATWKGEDEHRPQVSPGRVTVERGPLPLQAEAVPPERLRAFDAEGIRVGHYVIEAGAPGSVPRGVLTPEGFLPVP